MVEKRGNLSHYPKWVRLAYHSRLLRLLFFIYLAIMSAMLFASIAYGIIFLTYGYGLEELQELFQNTTSLSQQVVKIYQFFLSVGMFVVPPLVYAYLTAKNPWANLRLNKGASFKLWSILIIILFFTLIMENWLLAINKSIELPSFFDQLKAQEEEIDQMMKGFLQMNSVIDLLTNLVIVGVVAAMGEELFFRGFLQRFLSKWIGNVHWGIWMAALVFGAVHQQFYNFIPRVLLGALFGYLFYWAGTIWIPIGAHFLHNAVQVVGVYLYPQLLDKELSITQALNSNTMTVIIICSVLLAWTLNIFYVQATQPAES